MNSNEIFYELYKLTNDLEISINIFLVYTQNRNGCIIEKEKFKTEEMYNKLCTCLNNYFILYVNNTNEITIPYRSLLVLFNSEKNKNKISKGINELDIGELISYPCPNDNFDFENRKYSYSVYVIKDKIKYELLHVICKTKNDDVFKNMVDKFQKSLNILKLDLLVEFHRSPTQNNNIINVIIDKLKKNENIKKKFEKDAILKYFDYNHLIFVVYCEEKLKLNIFKHRKMLLVLLTYCKYIPIVIPGKYENEDEQKYKEYVMMLFDKIFIYQLEIIKIFMNYEFDNKTINKIATEYLFN